jgi:DNA polymerase (family X)
MTPENTSAPRGSKERSPLRLLGDVLPVADTLLEHLRLAAPGLRRASLTGSLRRRAELVDDAVEILASAEDAGRVIETFTGALGVAEVLHREEDRCIVLMGDGLRVELRLLPEEDFAAALLARTGSPSHLARLHALARQQGLHLSSRGLHHADGTRLSLPDEAALYQRLGLQYIPPELREDSGELEAALAGRLPEDLIDLEHLQGAVHAHSTWSDGRNSLEEMARAARALGLRYLTVTEHSQAAIYARGMKVDDLSRQWEEIDRLNEALPGIRLLKGIEVDILESGALDYPDHVLEQLEVVIGSIHVRHGLDEERMTRRVLRAMDNPHLHIIGHPTGRLLQSREPYPLRMEAVLDKAAERGVAMEVNGKPARLDLKAEHVRQAVQRGVPLVMSCDAHDVVNLGNLRYAVDTARRGWTRRGDVLNTLPADRFIETLHRC